MCGRSSLYEAPSELLEAYGLPPRLRDFVPRYNIAPSQDQWAIRRSPVGNMEVKLLRWGLIPSWTNDPSIGSRMINARAETIVEKPAFREALKSGRCLIIADGFYEWTRSGRAKTPYRFQMRGGKPFVFAGLWDRWNKGPSPIESCTIITTEADQTTAHIHDRVPVILDFDDSLKWMSADSPGAELRKILHPYAGGDLEIYPVSRAVNDATNDTPECIEPLETKAVETLRKPDQDNRNDSTQLHFII